jgi:hypothetical protein
MSAITITINDMHPLEIRSAVAGTQLENDADFERTLMRFLRPPIMFRPMPFVTQATITLNMMFKNIPVTVNITPKQ